MTRAQAYAAGILTDVTDTARELGFNLPVALTMGALEAMVRGKVDLNLVLKGAQAQGIGYFQVNGTPFVIAIGQGDAGEPVCNISY